MLFVWKGCVFLCRCLCGHGCLQLIKSLTWQCLVKDRKMQFLSCLSGSEKLGGGGGFHIMSMCLDHSASKHHLLPLCSLPVTSKGNWVREREIGTLCVCACMHVWTLCECLCLMCSLWSCLVLIGGGYEPEAHYPQWRRIHQPIERRQAFHDSLIKMIEGTWKILLSGSVCSECNFKRWMQTQN